MILLTVLVNVLTSKKEYVGKAVESVSDPEEIERKKRLATKFWTTLETNDIWMFFIMLALTFIFSYLYYIPFNKKPGRHYHPGYCALFGFLSVLLTGVATYLFCMFIVKVSYDYNLIIKMCCLNAFYSLLWFLACSWIFCNKSSTNAYRWFKM